MTKYHLCYIYSGFIQISVEQEKINYIYIVYIE